MVHVLDLVKMEKPDVKRRKSFGVCVYNYTHHQGILTLKIHKLC